MLRSAYTVSSISHCSRVLRVAWKDGVESVYPSTWLRASVRDSRFFNPNALMYEPSHVTFISREGAPLEDAVLTKSCKSSFEDLPENNCVWHHQSVHGSYQISNICFSALKRAFVI